jgi:maltooligosyltrehalose trehalohydrolase
MHNFKVWAPNAESVAVQVAGSTYLLQRAERGYWTAQVEQATAGMDYGYILEGQQPAIPDPRSPWQPNGVNGLSRLVDHDAFKWHDQQWQAPPLANAVIYELHVGTFTPEGTLDAAIGKLDYLKDLGITHVEVLPLASSPGQRGWGYDGVALFAPQENYGGPEAVKRFVDAAHARGLAVINDVVYNHFGPTGNYTGKYGPYITESHKTPWGGAVNLEEEGSTEVRRFFCDNALMWLRDYHFDGLRLDAVTAYIDRTAIHFLEQLAEEVKTLGAELGKHLFLIAESDLNDPRIVRAKEAGGFGLEAQWSDDFHHALWAVLTGEQRGYYEDFGAMHQLAKSLRNVFVYDGQYSEFRKRHHGRPVHDLPGYRFLGYIQDHDQVGNRAVGDRLGHLVSPGKMKIAAALVLMSPFVPMLFQGEEFAASAPFLYFTDHEDPELGKAVSEGRRKEFAGFGWSPEDIPDPQDPETFQRSQLDWREIGQGLHAEIFEWHKKLIALRRSSRQLVDGDLRATEVRFDENAQWLVLSRGRYQVVCNFSEKLNTIPIGEAGRIILASDTESSIAGDRIELPAESVVIIDGTILS